MPTPTIDVDLERCDRVYKEGETCKGVVIIDCESGFSHNGLSIYVTGNVDLSLNPSSVGLLETIYSSIKPQEIVNSKKTILKPGKVGPGKTEYKFEFVVKPDSAKTLFPTYHGVYITISYKLRAECEMRGWSSSTLKREIEFLMDKKPESKRPDPKPVDFSISPDTLEHVHESIKDTLPTFTFTGRLASSRCQINSPFTGELEIKEAKVPIKSISLQLVRVESIIFEDGTSKEPTEVQNIQIAAGDICRKLVIPLYMIFPRLFTCPTLQTSSFKIEFEMNLIVLFEDSHMITENFPQELYK